jgi:O-antigen/teichoic acid export membrane protein
VLFCSAWLLISFLTFTGPWIFKQWLGEEVFSQSYPFISLFLCYEMLLVLNIIPYYFLNGAGFVRLNTWFEIFTKALNLAGMFLFYQYFGVFGLIYGLLASLVISIPIQNYFLSKKVLLEAKPYKSILTVIPSLLSILLFNISSPILFIIVIILFMLSVKWLFVNTDFSKNSLASPFY